MPDAVADAPVMACPAPLTANDRIVLGHGSGGRLSAALLRDRFLPRFGNPVLNAMGDAGVVGIDGAQLAISTDTFVVSPVEFPGGNIGMLAIHGTVNDLAMMGARPRYISAGFILEEGLPIEVLDRVIASMGEAARDAGVELVAGDTKVVERGKGDGIFINTTGVGLMHPTFRPGPARAAAGDAVLISGPIGRHGMTIMSVREGIGFDGALTSDTANLHPLVEALRIAVDGDDEALQATAESHVHVLRDPTRGGVASVLNEIAASSKVGVELDEMALPIPELVAGACEMLGLDPLYVANEGILVAFVAEPFAEAALAALRAHPLGAGARRIGRAVGAHPGLVIMRTAMGGTRIVDLLPGDQMPRIC